MLVQTFLFFFYVLYGDMLNISKVAIIVLSALGENIKLFSKMTVTIYISSSTVWASKCSIVFIKI